MNSTLLRLQAYGHIVDSPALEPPIRWPGRILLACNGSADAEGAANLVASLAPEGARVRILNVQSYEFAPYTGDWGPLSDALERHDRLHVLMETAFRAPLQRLERENCHVDTAARLGNPADEILLETESWRADLVVIGRSAGHGFAKLFMGSASNHVVRHASVPVLVIPSG